MQTNSKSRNLLFWPQALSLRKISICPGSRWYDYQFNGAV
nr:unnamed protein product [Callosobruchus analis]